jgi:hypothetical protein
VPNNSVLQFGSAKCYRVEGTIELTSRSGLVFDGGGSTFRSFNAMISGNYADGQRAMWRINNSTAMAFRNMTIQGAYTHGGTLDQSLQYAHGIDLRGTNANIGPVTIQDVAGDGVYFGLYSSSGQASGSVHNSTIRRLGRNGVSLVSAHDVTVNQNSVSAAGFDLFDIEPNVGQGPGVQRTSITGNTLGGSYRLYAYSIVMNGPISSSTFSGNRINGAALRIGVINPSNQSYRPQTVAIQNNTSDTSIARPVEVHNTNGLTITGNTIPTSGTPMATVDNSCGVNVSGNSYPGGTSQVQITNPAC